MPRMLAPIISIKHYVAFTNATVSSGSVANTDLVTAIPNTAAPAATDEVTEGSIVKSVFIELWLNGLGASGATTQFTVILVKLPGGQNAPTVTDMLNLMAYDNKKNILFTSQGNLAGVGDGQSIPVMREWYKIPKGKQRFGLGDTLRLAVLPTGLDLKRCGISTYKEYK